MNITADGGPRDLFGMELGYNESLGIGTTAAQFNGNISAMKWSTNLGLEINKGELGYKFVYDPMNRLREANHAQKNTTWAGSTSFAESIPSYDLNGNIESLNRTGTAGSNMDELTYTYTGNQLTAVADAGIDTVGFKDGSTGTDYDYDANGNMVLDNNKEIDSIAYNHLNLPALVRKTSGDYITYTYDATGRKLTQRVFNSSDVLQKETDYLGAFFYENDTLKFINHAEGRVVMAEDEPEYQYHLKDHLGNVRMTFTVKEEVEDDKATLEAANMTVEQGTFLRYENVRRVQATLFDHTNGSSTGYPQRLNGTANEVYGLARSISVMPGDTVKAEVFVKYVDEESGNWTQPLIDLMSAIANNTGGIVMDGGNYSASTSSFSYGGFVNTGSSSDTAPKAFLSWILFDRNFVFLDGGFEQVSSSAKETGTDVAHERLSKELLIRQPGYVYIYLSNENGDPVEVFFDDFGVEHVKSPVVQVEDYYPFGLTFNSYSRENSVDQKYLYNGKEWQDELDLGWFDFGARMFQPDIGRWGNIDLSSDTYPEWSPYNYVFDNPVRLTDPDGMDPVDVTNAARAYMGTNYEWGGKNPTGRRIGAKDRVSARTAQFHTEASKNLRVAYDTKNAAMKADIYFTFGVPSRTSFGIDCSGLVAKAFNADPDKLMGDLKTGRADDQMKAFGDAQSDGTGTLHTDFGNLGQGDVVFQTNENGEAHHTMIATGDVKTDKDGNVTKFKTIEATKSGDKVRTKWRSVDSSMKIGHTFRKTDQQNAGPVRNDADRIRLSGFSADYQHVK